MEMNWSPVVKLRNSPESTVEVTRLVQFRMNDIKALVMLLTMPAATMALPKKTEQRMSQMVLSIPTIPPVDTSWLSDSLPVSTAVEPKYVIDKPFISPCAPLE